MTSVFKPHALSSARAVVLATAIAAGCLAQAAQAETAAKPTTTPTTTPTAKAEASHAASIKIPAIGMTLLNDVRNARMALFDGQTEAAAGILGKATSYMGGKTADYAIQLKDGYGLPLDSGLGFSEGFVPTKAHAHAISQAGKHMQAGEVARGLKAMADAGVKLEVKMVVVPYKATVDALEKALQDISAGAFHKANMELKSIETSVQVNAFTPGNLPHQGYALSDILAG